MICTKCDFESNDLREMAFHQILRHDRGVTTHPTSPTTYLYTPPTPQPQPNDLEEQ